MNQIYRQLTFSTMYKEEVSCKYSYLKVKWLTSNAGSIPGQGIKIPHAAGHTLQLPRLHATARESVHPREIPHAATKT